MILLADDLGLSPQDLVELNEFANAPMSGSSKRAGRILVRKDIRQRVSKSSTKDGDVKGSIHQDPFHRRRDCISENCSRHSGPDIWREIDWSKFSDDSDDEMLDVGINPAGAGIYDDCDDEITAMEGYMRMAIDAEQGNGRVSKHEDKRSILANGAEVGTARVVKRMRPAKLCTTTSSKTIETTVGQLGEGVWPGHH